MVTLIRPLCAFKFFASPLSLSVRQNILNVKSSHKRFYNNNNNLNINNTNNLLKHTNSHLYHCHKFCRFTSTQPSEIPSMKNSGKSDSDVKPPITRHSAYIKEYGLHFDFVDDPSYQPKLEKNELLIETQSSGLTFADMLQVQGKYQIKPNVPFIPGREACGKVIEIGSSVPKDAFNVGDLVFVFLPSGGGYTNRFVVDNTNAFRLPQSMDVKLANALYSPYITAWLGLLHKGKLKNSDKVLVSGAGGAVGMAAIDICANVFKAKVYGITSSPSKSEAIRQKGAFATIEIGSDMFKPHESSIKLDVDPNKKVTSESDAKPNKEEKSSKEGKRKNHIKEQVDYLTDKHGIDLFFDTVGGEVFEDSLKSMAFDGRIITVGFASGGIPTLPLNKLLWSNLTVSGYTMTNYFNRRQESPVFGEAFAKISEYWEKGYINPTTDATVYKFDQLNEAIQNLKEKKSIGRIILIP